MKLAMMLPAKPDLKWTLARQVGVEYAVTKAASDLSGLPPPWEFDSLRETARRFEEQGFRLCALEGDEFDMSRIKLGLPGRDEDIEHYRMLLRNMGRLGIGLLCYNFMAGVGWFRTRFDRPERGGALTSEFNRAELPPEPEEPVVTHEQMWRNYEYFLRAVLPVAEEAGVKLGLHPDDPPMEGRRGMPRLVYQPGLYQKVLDLNPSTSNKLEFCMGSIQEMTEGDIYQSILQYAGQGKISYCHFRNVKGKIPKYDEVFVDEGDIDMLKALSLLKQCDFDGVLIPDHTPEIDCQAPWHAGMAFALGYMRAAMQQLDRLGKL